MLMFLGISGRFMFFTADTARAGAPAMPACANPNTYTHTNTHTRRFDKKQTSEAKTLIEITAEHKKTQDRKHSWTNNNHLLTKCKSTETDNICKTYIQMPLELYMHMHFLFLEWWTSQPEPIRSQLWGHTDLNYSFTDSDVLSRTEHSSNGQKGGIAWKVNPPEDCGPVGVKMQGENYVKQKNGSGFEDKWCSDNHATTECRRQSFSH